MLANLRWGFSRGVAIALVYCVWVSIVYLVSGPEPFESIGVSYRSVIATYLGIGVASGSVIGMLSEADLLRWHEGFSEREARWLNLLADGFELAPNFLQEIHEHHRKIRALMSSSPITVSETTPAREIASLMHTRRIKRVPVVRDGRLIGIITRADLVRALADKLGELERPPGQPVGVDEALRLARERAIANARQGLGPLDEPE